MLDLVILASGQPRNFDPTIVKPGWFALILVISIAVGVVFLARSFSKHARRASQPWEFEKSQDKDPANEG